MAAGLRAGMVDADHLYTLVTTHTRAITAQLDEVVTTMEKVELRTARNDGGEPTLYSPNVWHRRKKVILVIMPANPPFLPHDQLLSEIRQR